MSYLISREDVIAYHKREIDRLEDIGRNGVICDISGARLNVDRQASDACLMMHRAAVHFINAVPAVPIPAAPAVKVKALEWVRGTNDYWYAIGVTMYVIWNKMEGYELEHKSTHPTLEAAKAAAQADYEARILAALA